MSRSPPASMPTTLSSTNVEQAQPATEVSALSLVLRLQWQSRRFSNILSAPLLRDHFLNRPIPIARSTIEFRLFDRHIVYCDVIAVLPHLTVPHLSHIGATTTQTYLIPPILPSLSPTALAPLTLHAFTEGADFAALLRLSLAGHSLLSRNTFQPPRSFLLHSPSGCGKSSTVSATAHTANATLLRLQPSHILPHADSPRALDTILHWYLSAAIAAAPCVLLLDDAHFVFPPDDHRSAAVLPSLLTRLAAPDLHAVAIVFCVSPAAHAVHSSLHSVVQWALPLQLRTYGPFAADVAVMQSACSRPLLQSRLRSAGYFHVIAQLVAWARKQPAGLGQDEKMTKSEGKPFNRELIFIDTANGDASVTRSASLIARWDELDGQLPGMRDVLRLLRRVLLWPITRAQALARLKVSVARGVLLYGAPGTGKTAIVRAAAAACDYCVVAVDAATIAHGEVGASEQRLSKAFAQATLQAPCVLFLDEVDTLFGGGADAAGARLVSTLVQCIGRAGTGVVVIAATNRPWVVATALLRPDRFDYCVRVGLPNAHARQCIASVYASRLCLAPNPHQCLLQLLGDGRADLFSGADIAGLCRRAAMIALSRGGDVDESDLKDAFAAMKPSVSRRDANRIETWRAD